MRGGEFGEPPHHGKGHQRADEEAQENRWAGKLHGERAAKEEARSDRGAQPNHRELPRREAAVQSLLALREGGVALGFEYGGSVAGHGAAWYQRWAAELAGSGGNVFRNLYDRTVCESTRLSFARRGIRQIIF